MKKLSDKKKADKADAKALKAPDSEEAANISFYQFTQAAECQCYCCSSKKGHLSTSCYWRDSKPKAK